MFECLVPAGGAFKRWRLIEDDCRQTLGFYSPVLCFLRGIEYDHLTASLCSYYHASLKWKLKHPSYCLFQVNNLVIRKHPEHSKFLMCSRVL